MFCARPHRWALGVLVAIATASGCGDKYSTEHLDRYGAVPAFALTDQTGAPFALADLRGKPAVINFVFTRCSTICPAFSLKMNRVGQRTRDVRDSLRLISFSVDPEHDTPAVLAEYATQFKADSSRWKFLTGEPDAVKRVVERGLKIAMDRRGVLSDGTPDIAHGNHFVLVDRTGEIRGYYHADDKERIDALVADARALAKVGP